MNLQNPFNCNYGWTLDFKLLPNIFYNRTHEAVVLFFDNCNKDKLVIPNDKLDNFLVDVIDEGKTTNNDFFEDEVQININLEKQHIINTDLSNNMKTIVQNLNNDITKLRQSLDEVNHVFNFKHDILDFIYEKNDILEIKNVNPSAYYNIMSIEDDKDIVSIPLYIDMDLENNLLFYFDEEMIEEPQSWRAGKIGTLYCSKDSLRKFYNIKRITKDFLNKMKTEILTNIGSHFIYLSESVAKAKT